MSLSETTGCSPSLARLFLDSGPDLVRSESIESWQDAPPLEALQQAVELDLGLDLGEVLPTVRHRLAQRVTGVRMASTDNLLGNQLFVIPSIAAQTSLLHGRVCALGLTVLVRGVPADQDGDRGDACLCQALSWQGPLHCCLSTETPCTPLVAVASLC